MFELTREIISQKLLQYMERYKIYLSDKLNNEQDYTKLLQFYNNHKTDKNYGCIYCKEMISLLEVTQQFNCSFKVLKDEQLEIFKLNEYRACEKITILAILSNESLTQMVEHYQYFLI